MNPYKVNRNHHWNKEISADSVEQVQLDGRLVWECYLFAASSVTPKQVVEFPTKEQAYQWAISQGADIVTEFGLDRDNPDEFPIGTEEIAAPGQTTLCKTHQKAQELIDSSEKIWWDDEKQEYNTIDYAIQKQWQQRLQTLREKSIAKINFIDSLDAVITRDEYRSLTDEQQRELIQAWLYPTNDDGEIDELIDEIPTDVHYEPNKPNLSKNNEVEDLTSIEFFVANVKSYHASVFGVYCSNCFESESTIAVTTNNYTMFEFCKPCYNKLKREMIARDTQERIGA